MAFTLKDACSLIQYGYTASAKTECNGPKFLRITDIVQDFINWDAVPYCEIPKDKTEKYLLKPGDIVIARTGATTGYAKYIRRNPESIFASYLVRLRIRPDIDSAFIGAIVESQEYKSYIKTHLGGSAQPNANAQILTSYPLSLPPFFVQKRISSILSTYDDLIENNTQRIQILEEMAQKIYTEWFVYFRFPGHEKVRMVDSELGMIPEGWEIKNLAEVSIITMGQSPKSEFYNEIGKGLPFHQGVSDFGWHYPTDRIYCTVQNRIAEEGDILLSVRAPVGRINVSTKKIVIGRGLCSIRSNRNGQYFLLSQLKNKFDKEDIIGSGTIFKAVTKKDMHEIRIVIPLLPIAETFQTVVEPMWKLIRLLSDKNNNLRQTRELLLPKLISGEIDVSEMPVPEEIAA